MNLRSKEKIKLYRVIFWLFVSRMFAIGAAFVYTKGEGDVVNIVMKQTGTIGSIIIQLLVCSLLSYLAYSYYRSAYQLQKSELRAHKLGFMEFVSQYQYGSTKGFFGNFLIRMPEKRIFFYFLGYIGPRIMIFSGLLIGGSTLLLIGMDKYREFYHSLNIPYALLALVFCTTIYYYIKFHQIEYERYRRKSRRMDHSSGSGSLESESIYKSRN